MKRLLQVLANLWQRALKTVARFPLTVVSLICAVSLIFYMISHDQASQSPETMVEKLMFTFLLGAFLGVAAQFLCERFPAVSRRRLLVYLVSVLLTGGYYLILYPAAGISFEVSVRTLVAVFAMFCAFIWLPSFREKFDFNIAALIHLKAAFVAVLYSAVLSMGCSAIIAGINILLFKINNDAYAYVMTLIWVFFAPVYYLSLLPRFNSEAEADREETIEASLYPKFLEVLVSYIAIPLAAIYTLVFAAYFCKILVTLNWPSGQLGGMVLAYAAAGLFIYILASPIENRFTAVYRRLFPIFLIPIVIMQLISVGIRLNAYGITESRYYVAGFGVFSIVCAVSLILKPVKRNGIIAVLAAMLAIISVMPPVDAFTVSRISQIDRLEKMLISEGVLADGRIQVKDNVPLKVREETTNILNYLNNRDYIKYVTWLPEDFNAYNDMNKILGFEPAYPQAEEYEEKEYFYLSSDMQEPYIISGYDIIYDSYSDRWAKDYAEEYDLTVRGKPYKLVFERISEMELQIKVMDAAGQEVISTGLYEFVKTLPLHSSPNGKGNIEAEKMTLEVENDGYKLRVMLQNINGFSGEGQDKGIDYDFIVMFGAPE
ncbi:MAG TPA: DUF4153 domain-containing protein [Syntrophomonadaceae bacterium]|nr:DUF4153 domain-containing protein [Syntrophomonadaceae bacterium]HPR92725.1 DUF4153 domain-containing protein [Syntrophomonadaceae bacterium]